MHRVARLLDPQVMSVALVMLVVEVGLRISTLPRLTRFLGIRLSGDSGSQHPQNVPLPADLPITWIRTRASVMNSVLRNSPFEDTCLRRALILGQRIRRLNPTLAIGVRYDDSRKLAAHAWLIVAGVALDPLAAQYETLHDLRRE